MKRTFLAIILILSDGCATYYQRTHRFQEAFASSFFQKADEILQKDKKGPKGKNRLLYLLNRGTVKYMLGQSQESNNLFMEADRYIEDQQKNYAKEALALILNPEVKDYRPEDFEKVMVHFYLAMNFLHLRNYDAAIVESKRINIKLHQLNDKYKDHKNKYQRDAFAHTLMGLIYDANEDYNNAFIAYRNAYEVYRKDYAKLFGFTVPEQLKKDLLRAAYRTGFYDEVAYYEKQFNMKYVPKNHDGGELVFFWLNGLGPVKSEWSINFTILPERNGFITFVNTDLGFAFPYYVGTKSRRERSLLGGLKMIRIAFPKYVARKRLYRNAKLDVDGMHYELETMQDINAIAFRSLKDRMMRELKSALLRFATKKVLEKTVNDKNVGLGTVFSIINAATEKADTRNWQTLPYTISYTRVPLTSGSHTLHLQAYGQNGLGQDQMIDVNIKRGQTIFRSYHNVQSF